MRWTPRLGPHLDAQAFGQASQSLGHRPRAAHRIPDSAVGLHVRDAAEHRGRLVRRGADVLREVVQHLGHPVVVDVASNRAGDGAAHAQFHHIAQGAQVERRLQVHGVLNVFDRFPEEEAIRDVMQFLGQLEEIGVAGFVTRS